jgi:hypothetical protein
LGCPRFRWSRDRFVAQFFFGSNPVLDILPVFPAALKIQLMSPASDFFSRWFSVCKHGNLLVCQYGIGGPTSAYEMWNYFPFAETLILICFGLDNLLSCLAQVSIGSLVCFVVSLPPEK